MSAYDETKYRADRAAQDRIARGAPVLIAAPGVLYGPGDTSQLGQQFRLAARGKLRYMAFPTLGFAAVYVDDAADGILRVLDRGRIGRPTCSAASGRRCAGDRDGSRVGGKRAPRLVMPTWAIELSVPLGRWLGPLAGQPQNLREVVTASHDVTYWASDAKAREELGYAPRGLEAGLQELVRAAA